MDIAGSVSVDMNCAIGMWPGPLKGGCGTGVVVTGQYVQEVREHKTEQDIAEAKMRAASGKGPGAVSLDEKGKKKEPYKPPMFSKHGYHVMPFEMSALQVGAGFGMGGIVDLCVPCCLSLFLASRHLRIRSTFPGYSVKVPQGQSFKYNYFHGTNEPLLESSIDAEIEVLPGSLSVSHFDLHAYVFIGPNFAVNLE